MKKSIPILLLMMQPLFAFWSSSPKSNIPVSREATILEHTNSAEVLVKATGYADEVEELDTDLKRAALWHLLFGGTDPIIKQESEKMSFKPHAESFFNTKTVQTFIPWMAEKITAQRKIETEEENKSIKRVRSLKINKNMVRGWLVKKGIIPDQSELLEEMGTPFIMVLPDAPKGENPLDVFATNKLASHSAGAMESFLTARQYEVVIPRAMNEIDQLVDLQGENKGIEEDLSYKLSLSIGADVYITFSGTVDRVGNTHKASVVIKAYETTTGRALGTETGYSKDRPVQTKQKVLVEEAVNDAMEKVLSRLTQYWKKDQEKGLQYKVVLKLSPEWNEDQRENITDGLEDILEEAFPKNKEIVSTDKTMDYIVWAHRSEYKRASKIYRKLKKEFGKRVSGGKISKISTNKKLVILKVKLAN
jgi:hypothetical protein